MLSIAIPSQNTRSGILGRDRGLLKRTIEDRGLIPGQGQEYSTRDLYSMPRPPSASQTPKS
ncbi:unnamed protein product, partial [Linum tenue]